MRPGTFILPVTLPHLRRCRYATSDLRRNSGFRHAAGADAPGAHLHALVGLSVKHPNTLKIGIPPPPRQIVGVADPVPINRALVANVAASHEGKLPYEI